AAPGHDGWLPPEQYMGAGPYLGMAQKYTILLLQKSASLSRYTAAHQGWASCDPVRFHDHKFGCAFVGLAEESSHGLLRDDLALRTHLAFHLAFVLHTSYRSFGHNLPAWIVTGLSHWYARRVCTRFPVYDLRAPGETANKQYEQWDRRWQPL